ncbi:MAG: hypothetical protein WAM62_08660 [Pseudolabrys sp.]
MPELAAKPAETGAAPDVTIRLGDTGEVAEPRYAGPVFQIGIDDYRLEVRNAARYRVRNGNEIIVAPFPGSSARNVRLFLLGTAFGALCQQRRLLPLHASAIEVDGQCIAFAGLSGIGKSTLAAFFQGRGYNVISDDICVVSLDAQGRPLAWPGIPRLKLWRDAAEALARDVSKLEIDHDGMEKYHFPTYHDASQAPLPLRRLYILHEAPLPALEQTTRLAGTNAFEALLANTYRRNLLAPMAQTASHFAICASLIKHIDIYSAGRHKGFDVFAAWAEKLEKNFLGDEP